MAYMVDKFTLDDGRIRCLMINDDKLEVRTYRSGRLPSCEENHPHAGDLSISRFGNRIKFGDFAEAELGPHRSIKYTKGDFRVRELLNSYLGCKENTKFMDF